MPDDIDARLAPHARRADRQIVNLMADARAHAHVGHLAFATQRLADLQTVLLTADGRGTIGDARAAAYRHAHAEFDHEIHDAARRYPTREGADAARTAPIGGIDARRELSARIDEARRGLVAAASSLGGPDADRATAIDAWHERHASGLRAWARRRLSDDQVAIHAAAGSLRTKAEFRPADAASPES